MKRLVTTASVLLFPFLGKAEDVAPDVTISTNATGAQVQWQGSALETYFLQNSENLEDWIFYSFLAYGEGQNQNPWQLSVTGNNGVPFPSELFFRVSMVNTPVISALEAESADFDGDGLPNLFELQSVPQTSPLQFDSDGNGVGDGAEDLDNNGLGDGWELAHFGAVGQDPNGDPDGDGLSNLEEFLIGGLPNVVGFQLSEGAEHYQYDDLSRLTKVLGAQQRQVTYDPSGNIEEAK